MENLFEPDLDLSGIELPNEIERNSEIFNDSYNKDNRQTIKNIITDMDFFDFDESDREAISNIPVQSDGIQEV